MKSGPNKKDENPELRPDGWERFEKAVDAAVASGPRHNPKSKPKTKDKPSR